MESRLSRYCLILLAALFVVAPAQASDLVTVADILDAVRAELRLPDIEEMDVESYGLQFTNEAIRALALNVPKRVADTITIAARQFRYDLDTALFLWGGLAISPMTMIYTSYDSTAIYGVPLMQEPNQMGMVPWAANQVAGFRLEGHTVYLWPPSPALGKIEVWGPASYPAVTDTTDSLTAIPDDHRMGLVYYVAASFTDGVWQEKFARMTTLWADFVYLKTGRRPFTFPGE